MNTDNALQIDQEMFSKVFEYSANSPTGLIYKFCAKIPGRAEIVHGTHAGTYGYTNRNGVQVPHMIRVRFRGKLYPVHRVIWTLLRGLIPKDFVIDHLDGNPFNNKIENLRCIDSHENTRNAKRRVDNKTGVNGVREMSNGTGNEYIYASYYDHNKKIIGKCWSLLSHTEDEAVMLAKMWRQNELKILAENGIVFTERHGKDT